jgi:hypothetical protein
MIGGTAAHVAIHGAVDVSVARRSVAGKQRCGAHDLPGLAVAALRHIEFTPEWNALYMTRYNNIRHPARSRCRPTPPTKRCDGRSPAHITVHWGGPERVLEAYYDIAVIDHVRFGPDARVIWPGTPGKSTARVCGSKGRFPPSRRSVGLRSTSALGGAEGQYPVTPNARSPAESGCSLRDPGRSLPRPIETSKATVCYVRNTSIHAIRSVATNVRSGSG